MSLSSLRITWSFFIINICVVTSQDCSIETYNACMDPFVAGDPMNSVVPWYTLAVVTDICRRLQQFKQCMSTVIPHCTTARRLIYQGTVDGYNFLCDSGFEEYRAHQQQCFSLPGVQKEGQSCSSMYNQQVNRLFSDNQTDNKYKTDRLCQYSNNYVDCVSNALESFCSAEAASWQTTYDSKQLCPLLVGAQCKDWDSKCFNSGFTTTIGLIPSVTSSSGLSSSSLIILLVCVIVFVVILIIGAVIITIFIVARRRRPRSNNDIPVSLPSAGIELPPPYPGPFICNGLFSQTTQPEDNARAEAMLTLPSRDAATVNEAAKASANVDQAQRDGFFIPDTIEDMDEQMYGAVSQPAVVEQRSYKDKIRFIPDHMMTDSYDDIGSGSLTPGQFTSSSSSPPPLSTSSSTSSTAALLHHHQLHQPKSSAAKSKQSVQNANQRSVKSPFDDHRQHVSSSIDAASHRGQGTAFVNAGCPDVYAQASSTAMNNSITSNPSGSTSPSAGQQTASPLTLHVSSSMSSPASSANFDHVDHSQLSDDIDYY